MSLSSYLITLTSVAILVTISQLIMPEGRMKGITKIVFQFVLIVTLVSPILSKNVDFNLNYDSVEFSVDQTAVNYLKEERAKILENECIEKLELEGIKGVKINIQFNRDFDKTYIEKVVLNFDDLVITAQTEHINITRKTVLLVCEMLKVNEGVIIIE